MEATAPAPLSYKPDGIPPPLAQSIRFLFAGVQVGLVLYGISAIIFVQCFKAVTRMLKVPGRNTFSKRLQLTHACLIFICGTLFIAADAWLITVSSLDYPLFKGGPYGWVLANYNHPVGLMGNVSFEVTAWLADGFMLFRCYIVYAQVARHWMWAILLLPSLLYLASIATGILLLVQVSLPRSTLYSNVNFGLTTFSLTASLNILITLLISARLVVHRLRMQKIMGQGRDKASLRMYTSISAILVESAALYTAAFVMFIVPYVMKHPVARFFLPILSMVQVISPLLVGLRLARQMAWTRTTTTGATAVTEGGMRFGSRGGTTAGSSTVLSRQDGVTLSISLETRKEYSSDYIESKV